MTEEKNINEVLEEIDDILSPIELNGVQDFTGENAPQEVTSEEEITNFFEKDLTEEEAAASPDFFETDIKETQERFVVEGLYRRRTSRSLPVETVKYKHIIISPLKGLQKELERVIRIADNFFKSIKTFTAKELVLDTKDPKAKPKLKTKPKTGGKK